MLSTVVTCYSSCPKATEYYSYQIKLMLYFKYLDNLRLKKCPYVIFFIQSDKSIDFVKLRILRSKPQIVIKINDLNTKFFKQSDVDKFFIFHDDSEARNSTKHKTSEAYMRISPENFSYSV